MVKENVSIVRHNPQAVYVCFYSLLSALQHIKRTFYNYERWKHHKIYEKCVQKNTLFMS